MKKIALCLFVLVSAISGAQSGILTVDVHANGTDIRDVLYQLFTQAKKSYVLQPGVHEALNLNLVNVEFEEALQIVCEAGQLTADQQNGIYYIGRKKPGFASSAQKLDLGKPKAAAKCLDRKVLDRKVSTKLAKAPLKVVLAEFTKQTHVTFELDPKVPAYKLDAFLTKLTLKQALERIGKAAKLEYEFTNHRTIRIRKSDNFDLG